MSTPASRAAFLYVPRQRREMTGGAYYLRRTPARPAPGPLGEGVHVLTRVLSRGRPLRAAGRHRHRDERATWPQVMSLIGQTMFGNAPGLMLALGDHPEAAFPFHRPVIGMHQGRHVTGEHE